VRREEGDGAVRILGEHFWPLVVDIGKAVAVSRRSVLLDGLDIKRTWIYSVPSPPPPFRKRSATALRSWLTLRF
jgi:hypothetical protein